MLTIENRTKGMLDLGTFVFDGKQYPVILGSSLDTHGVQNPERGNKKQCHAPIKQFPRGVLEQGIRLKAWRGMIDAREIEIKGPSVRL